MELATNTFGKGLLMDTNPMVLGTDTLTDCLNGTLITMNGNEGILQNDMGNRRINNAFLPSGYEPVGIKEYGGIIYVAAYNPITNKSLVGSFPSPLRKIDNKKQFEKEFNLTDFSLDTNIEDNSYLGIKVLKLDSFMIPITEDNSLRAGDKFTIYSADLYNPDITKDLTNFNNTSTDGFKAYSPKNKKYTLSVGILNSLNEFVDITKTLCRWDKNELITYTASLSDIYKFNDGYFIASEFLNKNLIESLADSNLIKSRQKIAINTYAYKLIGPMYLKVAYNHIENFNYNIYGVREEDEIEEVDGESKVIKKATLWIEGYLTYNCPDITSDSEYELTGGNEYYLTFDEVIPSFNGFDLIIDNEKRNPSDTVYEKSKYDPDSNTYTVKIVKKYVGVNSDDDNILNYVIGVDSGIKTSDNKLVYLKGLSVKSSLDYNLLGSSLVSIKEWKFYNNIEEEKTILTFTLNAYPQYGESFENLSLKFIKKDNNTINDTSNDTSNDTIIKTIENLPVYNGRQTITLDWEDRFEKRKVYLVSLSYNSSEGENPRNLGNKWILTTRLFNEFYNSSILDFCNNTNANFESKKKVKLGIKTGLVNNSYFDNDIEEGGLVVINPSSAPEKIDWKITHKYKLNVTHNSEIYIINEELYPDYITLNGNLSLSANLESVGLSINNSSEIKIYSTVETINLVSNLGLLNTDFSDLIDIISKNEVQNINNLDVLKNIFNISNISVNSNTLSCEISFSDHYIGKPSLVSQIKNVFNKFSNSSPDMYPHAGKEYFGGVYANFNTVTGGDNGHFLETTVISDNLQYSNYHGNIYDMLVTLPSDSGLYNSLTERISDLWLEGEYIFKINNYAGSINDALNKWIPENMPFTYVDVFRVNYISNIKAIGNVNTYIALCNDEENISNIPWNKTIAAPSGRVLWRTSDGGWAFFKAPFFPQRNVSSGQESELGAAQDQRDARFRNFLMSTLGEYIYCMYNEYNNNQISAYVSNSNYKHTSNYNIPLNIIATYSAESNNIIFKNNNIDLIGFDLDSDINQISSTLSSINLKSSERFLDKISTFDVDSISNIYIDGKTTDSEGKNLDPTLIYVLLDDQLVKSNKSKLFYVDTTRQVDGQNLLLYNGKTYGNPQFRYNILNPRTDLLGKINLYINSDYGFGKIYDASENSWTVLDFTDVRIVDL